MASFRSGWSARRVARQFRVSLSTVQFWLARAGSKRLDDVDWTDRSSRPHHVPTRTPRSTRAALGRLRRQLARDDLGFIGAPVVQAAFRRLHPHAPVPAIATIHRILRAQGFMDRVHRRRTAAPPPGWYLPAHSSAPPELDSFDLIEGLGLGEAGPFDVLTGRALWDDSRLAVPAPHWSARSIATQLLQHWQHHGRPAYAQFDNDLRFHGSRHPPGSLGRIVRLCLGLGIVPVFAPPRESGFQAGIEHFNGLWQRQVWQRFEFRTLTQVQQRSARFVLAYMRLLRQRGTEPPAARSAFPLGWRPDYRTVPHGRVFFLRRTNERGFIEVLNHRLRADPDWPHRLLRCELELPAQILRCYRLRRRAPADQPLVATLPLPCCLGPIRLGRLD